MFQNVDVLARSINRPQSQGEVVCVCCSSMEFWWSITTWITSGWTAGSTKKKITGKQIDETKSDQRGDGSWLICWCWKLWKAMDERKCTQERDMDPRKLLFGENVGWNVTSGVEEGTWCDHWSGCTGGVLSEYKLASLQQQQRDPGRIEKQLQDRCLVKMSLWDVDVDLGWFECCRCWGNGEGVVDLTVRWRSWPVFGYVSFFFFDFPILILGCLGGWRITQYTPHSLYTTQKYRYI